ncbi:MAG: hypothetical protein LQ342_002272 [Letrouitia transgressa]|nr:MAG: hypothetical protein LQ342_002272 [Letrouitia transgressa]
MKVKAFFAASAIFHSFTQLAAAAPPSQPAAALLSCVKKALIGKNVEQRIVTRANDTYTSASTGSLLVTQYPAVIAYVTSTAEVRPLIRCGQNTGYKVTPRSGAHHFENWSSFNGTLVVDTSHMDYVKIAPDASTATIGSGARLGKIYSLLNQKGVTWNAGICPTVALGGYLAVGGYNMQMRAYGMAVDSVQSAKLILADGRTVTASPTENSDLFWAIRGGGTFGFTLEATLKTVVIPRSAVVWMNFTGPNRYAATQKYLDWAPRQDPLFNSQLNLFSNYAQVLGWYIGKSDAELTSIVKASGLRDIPGVDIRISGNCSTENSRNLWQYTQTTCTDDATAHKLFSTFYNTVPDPFTPIPGAKPFGFDDIPALPKEPKAKPWPRVSLINKTYFITKSRPLTPEVVRYITDKSGALPLELKFWTEMTAFNISKPAVSAFAWQSDATMLFRFQVEHSTDPKLEAIAEKFMVDLDKFLVPRIGSASYSGYTDAHLSSKNPRSSYWGKNVCRLSAIKRKYDPHNFFSDPFSIGPTPAGSACY